jgi:rRNA processing protein Gar1
VAAATAADVKAGASVYDQNGGLVGKVDSVSGKNAVISTGAVKASVPVSSFAKGDKGLVMSMSKAELDAAAKPNTAKAKKKPQ